MCSLFCWTFLILFDLSRWLGVPRLRSVAKDASAYMVACVYGLVLEPYVFERAVAPTSDCMEFLPDENRFRNPPPSGQSGRTLSTSMAGAATTVYSPFQKRNGPTMGSSCSLGCIR